MNDYNSLLKKEERYVEIDRNFVRPIIMPFKVISYNVERMDVKYGLENVTFKQDIIGEYLDTERTHSFTMSLMYTKEEMIRFNDTGCLCKSYYQNRSTIIRLNNPEVKKALDKIYRQKGFITHTEKKKLQCEYKYVNNVIKDILKKYGE